MVSNAHRLPFRTYLNAIATEQVVFPTPPVPQMKCTSAECVFTFDTTKVRWTCSTLDFDCGEWFHRVPHVCPEDGCATSLAIAIAVEGFDATYSACLHKKAEHCVGCATPLNLK